MALPASAGQLALGHPQGLSNFGDTWPSTSQRSIPERLNLVRRISSDEYAFVRRLTQKFWV
jgi:hypothetical protein